VNSQEVRFGLVGGTAPVKKVVLDIPLLIPTNTYYTYFEESEGAGLINETKFFNSVHLGALFNVSYKRFSLNLEPQFYIERMRFRFQYFNTDMERIIGCKAFRMPVYLTYKFFKKERSSYVLCGINVINETNWDIQFPGDGFYLNGKPAYLETENYGDDHFQDVLYDGRTYLNLNVGLGKQFKYINSSIRFQKPIGGVNERLPVRTFKVEWTLSWLFLSTKDFTKKHPLYVD
jgi:hypothetical protein